MQLSGVIAGVRGVHPAFEKRRVPDKALADFFTSYQRDLVSRALERNREYLAQVANIMFDINSQNKPGVAGVNTTGGLPTDISQAAVVSQVQSPTGTLVEADADNAQIAVAERAVGSATATTLTPLVAPAWTVDEHFNRWAVITAGKGAGTAPRAIASNTVGVLTVTQAWEIIPDATSRFKVVYQLLEAETDLGAVSSFPFTLKERGYLVRLDVNGLPYVDLSKPLVAQYDVGIPIPPHHHVVGGQVRFTSDTEDILPFEIQTYKARFQPRTFYSGYIMNGQLFLNGTDQDWADVQSIELRYTPIPPAFTALTDYFLVPDTAYSTLVAGGALAAGLRVNGLPDVPKIDTSSLGEAAAAAEKTFLTNVSIRKRRVGQIKEG